MGICESSQRDKKINQNNLIKKQWYVKKICPIGKGGFGIVRKKIYKLNIILGLES